MRQESCQSAFSVGDHRFGSSDQSESSACRPAFLRHAIIDGVPCGVRWDLGGMQKVHHCMVYSPNPSFLSHFTKTFVTDSCKDIAPTFFPVICPFPPVK
jgi:hypothetical protein